MLVIRGYCDTLVGATASRQILLQMCDNQQINKLKVYRYSSVLPQKISGKL